MDCYSAAADLKNLLVAHSNAETQAAALDEISCSAEEHEKRFITLGPGYSVLPLDHLLLQAFANSTDQTLEVLRIDDQINGLSQQSLVSALDGNKSQDLHLSLRLAVCEGVKVMYNKYQDKKWSQVQETARSIIQNLDGDLDTEQMALPLTSPPGGSTNVDKAADKWSMAFCEFYRDN